MNQIFVEDVTSYILNLIGPSRTLGRISLVSKSAARETYSLMPTAPVISDRIMRPHEIILQYTGTKLRELFIKTFRSFPTIIKHVEGFCPNLQRLELSASLIETFKAFYPQLGRLLTRVTAFGVLSGPRETASHDEYLRVCLKLFRSALNESKSNKLISVTHFRLDFAPFTLDGASHLVSILEILRPSLESIDAPLCPFGDMIWPALGQCTSLCEVRNLVMDHTDWNNDLGEHLLRALLPTKVGLNITLTDTGRARNLRPRYIFDAMLEDFQPAQIVAALDRLGTRVMDPRSCANLLKRLCIVQSSHFVKEFLPKYIGGAYSASFPNVEEVKPHLVSARFWEVAIHRLRVKQFQQMVRLLGPIALDSRNPSYVPLIGALLERQKGFKPAYISTYEKCGVPLDAATLRSVDIHGANIFKYPISHSAVSWIVSVIESQDIVKMLHQRVSLPNGAELVPIVLHVRSPESPRGFLAELVLRLGHETVLSFQDMRNFIEFAQECIDSEEWDLFESAVNATGLSNITPDARGTILWYAYYVESERTHPRGGFFDYWLDLIWSDPQASTELRFFPETGDDICRAFVAPSWATLQERLFEILARYKTELLEQAQQRNHLRHFTMSLMEFLLSRVAKDKSFDGNHYVDSIIHEIFVPAARVFPRTEYSLTAHLLGAAEAHSKIDPVIFQQLYVTCLSIEFAPEEAQHHKESRKRIAEFIVRCVDLADRDWIGQYLETWLELLDTEDLNYVHDGWTVLEALLDAKNGHLLPNLPDFVVKLVQRGARIRAFDVGRREHEFDIQALEIYLDALRSTGVQRA